MLKKNFCWICLMSFWVIFLSGCSGSGEGGPTPTPLPPVVSYEKAIFTVKRGPVVAVKDLVGLVVPSKQDDMFFRASGYVTRLAVKQGDPVKKGDVLAELQVDDLVNQLQQARIDLEVAQANLAKEKSQNAYDLARAQADVVIAYKRVELAQLEYGTAADLNLEIAQQNLIVAQEALKLAQADVSSYMEQAVKRSELAVQRLEGLVNERQILAPYDGVILRVSVRSGQQIDAYKLAISLGDPSQLVVRAQYDSDLAAKMTEDSEVGMYLSVEKTGDPFKLKYMPYFMPASAGSGDGQADNATNTTDYLYFTLPADAPMDQLTVGRTVTLSAVLGRKEDALLLPPAAIRAYKDLNFVIVQDGQTRRRVEINQIGLKGTDLWEVVAELNEGDQVVGP